MKIKYLAKIKNDGDGYHVSFPDFPDAFTFGVDLDEALENAQECLSLVLEDLLLCGVEPPSAISKKQKGYYWVVPDPDIQVAYQIFILKKNSGLTTSDLARKLKTSWSSLNRIEKAGSNPTLNQLIRVADALGKKITIELTD